MGEDSVQPFLDYENKWTIVLALTSNKGSHDFQFIEDKKRKASIPTHLKQRLKNGETKKT